MEVVIDRSRWLRGEGEYASRLLRGDSKMCCLGFVGRACGIDADDLLDIGAPGGVFGEPRRCWPSWLTQGVGDADELMTDNDSTTIDDREREHLLAARMAKHGITLRFVDSVEG